MKQMTLAAVAALLFVSVPGRAQECPTGFDCAGFGQPIGKAGSDKADFFGTFRPALTMGFDVRSIGWNGPLPEGEFGWDYDKSQWADKLGMSLGVHVALLRRDHFRFPTLGVHVAEVEVPARMGYSVDAAVGGEVVAQRRLNKDGSLASEVSVGVSVTRSMLGPQRGVWGLRLGFAIR